MKGNGSTLNDFKVGDKVIVEDVSDVYKDTISSHYSPYLNLVGEIYCIEELKGVLRVKFNGKEEGFYPWRVRKVDQDTVCSGISEEPNPYRELVPIDGFQPKNIETHTINKHGRRVWKWFSISQSREALNNWKRGEIQKFRSDIQRQILSVPVCPKCYKLVSVYINCKDSDMGITLSPFFKCEECYNK